MNLEKYGPWALVIGGSEGVGAAFARILAADGFKLVLVARRQEPMDDLAKELRGRSAQVRVLSADLSHSNVLDQVRAVTDDIEIGLLVYSAGANNTRGLFVNLPEEITQSVIAINVLGQANFTRHYGALMVKRGRGGIILAGSLSGYLESPTLAAYTASNSFSRIFSEALWAECAPLGVDVLHLNIGFTATPAMARLGMPIALAEPPENVAREGLENIANGPVWIISTPGNVDRARLISRIDDRADIVRANAIPAREDTAKAATDHQNWRAVSRRLSDSPPDWFTHAVTAKRDSRCVTVEGCLIHYLQWGDPKRPGLVLIPPSGGHAHWFAHVAPLLADQFHVVAMDPSGCGDSGRRDVYTQDLVTAEIAAVCEDCGMSRAGVKPTLVGHSAGAPFVVRAALAFGARLLGVMAIDGLRYAELDRDPAIKVLKGPRPVRRQARVHASLDEAVARFRLTPAPLAPVANGFVVDYIARHSFRQKEGGWISKFDPAQGATIGLALELRDKLKDLKCAAAAIYAEHTHLADGSVADIMTELNDGVATVFVIPGSNHFPQIDSPFSFVTAIKSVALTWIANTRVRSQI